MVKTEFQKDDRTKHESSKRKRPYRDINDAMVRENEVAQEVRNRNNGEQATNKTSTVRVPKRKKRKKSSRRSHSSDPKKPLAGMTISVSISTDNTKAKDAKRRDNDDIETAPNTYNKVCRSCKELGADVIDLVCKRVDLLICSEAAVRQATQRVRKAIKRSKPLVSVTWLEQCRKQGRKMDIEEYRLDKNAKDAIQNREDRLRLLEDTLDDTNYEAIPGAGWSEPKELG